MERLPVRADIIGEVDLRVAHENTIAEYLKLAQLGLVVFSFFIPFDRGAHLDQLVDLDVALIIGLLLLRRQHIGVAREDHLEEGFRPHATLYLDTVHVDGELGLDVRHFLSR